MATVTCIVNYDKDRKEVTKTYQVQFDQNDKIRILSETPYLAVKAANATARKLFPALLNGSHQPARPKRGKSMTKAKAPKPGERYVIDAAPLNQKVKSRTSPAKSQVCYYSLENVKLATFLCGERVNGKFQKYELYNAGDGPEFPNGARPYRPPKP